MLLEQIIKSSQEELKDFLALELQKSGYAPQCLPGFLYATGKIPVMLVAHLDKKLEERVRTINYSDDGNILTSPQGIGGDDRAGVYMILQIIKELPCYVLFCEDVEKHGVGAILFSDSGIMPDVNYIIELDRRGSDDAVYYECYNPYFVEFFSNFGFIETEGNFTDIAIVAPTLGIAAVNLSTGFYDEHQVYERIDLSVVNNNINRVKEIIKTKTERFDYLAFRD
jgi:hypothetical protein